MLMCGFARFNAISYLWVKIKQMNIDKLLEHHEKAIKILELIKSANRSIIAKKETYNISYIWHPDLAKQVLEDIEITQAARERLINYYKSRYTI